MKDPECPGGALEDGASSSQSIVDFGSPQSLKRSDHNVKYALAGLVALLTFIVYIASLQNEFVEWDDSQYVFENLHIRSFDLAFFKWAFFDFYAANWHPLTWISHALDYAAWGLNPMGHHLTNNILHAVNTFLVVALVVRLIEAVHDSPFTIHGSRLTSHDSRFTLIAAAVTGLLFGLHPLHVESVAWIAERKDLLCALFFLLSILKYISYSSHKTYKTYFLALFFFILALLSKPMAVSLPFVLLILDWYPFGKIRSLKTFLSAVLEKLPFMALSIGSSILTMLAQKKAMVLTEYVPLWARSLVAAKALIAYIWKMLMPLNLVPFYQYPSLLDIGSAEYILSLILVAGITAACIRLAGKQRLWLAVWGYYVLTLIPVLGIIQVGSQSMADRYTYLPSIGFFLIIGLLIAWCAQKMLKQVSVIKYSGAAAAFFLLLFLSFLTYKQIEVWKNSFSLWTYVIEMDPEKFPGAYNNRGHAFYINGQLDRAIDDFNQAIRLDPISSKAYLNRGAAFVDKGQLDRANADFDKAIELNPSYSQAYNAKGSLFGMSGYPEKAIEQFSKAIEIDPAYSAAYGNRGAVYLLIGQNNRALEDIDKAIQLDPYYALNYLARGNIYLAGGNRERAVSDFKKACDLGHKEACAAAQN